VGVIVSHEAAYAAKQAGDLKGLYQFKLAQMANISESYVSKIFRGGKSVEPEHLASVSRALDIDPEIFCKECPLHKEKAIWNRIHGRIPQRDRPGAA